MKELVELTREERLASVCKFTEENYPAFQKSLAEGRSNERFSSMSLWGFFERHALKAFFLDKNLELAKLYFSRCGLLDILLTEKYDEKLLDYGINHFTYALLSDNREVVKRYSTLKHSNYEQMLKYGNLAPMYILQCLLRDDFDEFEKAMVIMKSKTVKKFKMELDAEYYQAIAERNKDKAEAIINELLTPKHHNRRNKHEILIREFVSHPSLGYAKLAWIKGLEVNIEHKLVPKELLPARPLDDYSIAPYYPGIDENGSYAK